MATFRVVCQKHVVFPNSKLFWAKIWTNGDIPGGLSETCGFFYTRNYFWHRFGHMAISRVLYQKHVVFSNSKLFWAENLDRWRFSGCFIRNMWFFQTRNHFGLKIWTNGDIPGGLSETCGFFTLEIILG